MDEDSNNPDVYDNDENYLEMLKSLAKPSKEKFDIEKSQKYQGRKVSKVRPDDSDQDELTYEAPPPKKKIKQNKQVKKVALIDQINHIEKEDMQIINNTQEDLEKMRNTATCLKQQFMLLRDLNSYRQGLQRVLEWTKRLPRNPQLFDQDGSQRAQLILILQNNVRQLMDNREALYNTGITYSYDLNGLLQMRKKTEGLLEEDILRWSQKTQLLGNIQKKQGLTGSLNLGSLLQTPIGQAQKAMQNKDKLIQKSQLKRGVFRILGEPVEDLQKAQNNLIFDDTDFQLELLQEAMTALPEESGDMLNQATQQYLLKRRAQDQEKQHKDVDRKASKSRKLKFEPHPKIINFMVPISNNFELEAREDIVNSLLGRQAQDHNQGKRSQNKEKNNFTLI